MRTLRLPACMAALGASLLAPHGAGQTRFGKLYTFDEGNVGYQEPEGIIAGPNGVLYGITGYGPDGSVYELQPTPATAKAGEKWTATTLYSFTGQNGDGANGYAPAIPVVGANGNIYGTTTWGGTFGFGTVFELQRPASGGTWTESVLYSFTGSYGYSNVIDGANGALYGVSSGGGAFGQGMVFELTPPSLGAGYPDGTWTARVLYSFTGAADGGNPAGLSKGPHGIFYGTASNGGSEGEGAVFELTPPSKPGGVWTETVLYSFLGGEAGANPSGPLVVNDDGTLYGTAASSVFQLTPPTPSAAVGAAWTQTMLYDFWGELVGGPDSPLVVRNGAIYGTTSPLACGCTCSGGSVYELQPPGPSGGAWTRTNLYRFYTSEPFGSFVVDKDGAVFGTTLNGQGELGLPFFYKIDPSVPEDSDEEIPPCGVCCELRNAANSRQRH